MASQVHVKACAKYIIDSNDSPLATLLSKGVGAATRTIWVLLQDENSLTALGKKIRTGTSARSTANNDGVKLWRDEFGTEGAGTDGADLANLLPRPGNVDEEGKDGQDGCESEEGPQTDDSAWTSTGASRRISHDLVRHWIEKVIHVARLEIPIQ